MAVECGWTKEYIFKNLTLTQIRRYVEVISRRKNIELARKAESFFYACSAGFGGINIEMFNKYIDDLEGIDRVVNVDESLNKLKLDGIELEEN